MKRMLSRLAGISCLLLVFSCNQLQKAQETLSSTNRETIMRDEFLPVTKLESDKLLDRVIRRKKLDSLYLMLSAKYPPDEPIGKDSVLRIFKTPLPPVVDSIPYASKKIDFVEPHLNERQVRILRAETLVEKPYLTGHVDYEKKGRAKEGTWSVLVMDLGYFPEWVLVQQFDQALKGGKSELTAMQFFLEFDQIVSHGGHNWVKMITPEAFKRTGAVATAFTTTWNNRFLVTVTSTDSTTKALDSFDKVVDVAWLTRLKR